MTQNIQKVAVLGSGVMGSQIAAQVANAGIPVLLLDIVLKDKPDKNFLAKAALEKLQKMDPAPFMSSKAAKLVTPGNLEDDLPKLADSGTTTPETPRLSYSFCSAFVTVPTCAFGTTTTVRP